jgi:hypothetical protein
MLVNRSSWHSRIYLWWYKRKYGGVPMRTNLCPYMRAILFWSWLRWIFFDGFIGKVPVAPFTYVFLLVEIPRWLGVLSYSLKVAFLTLYAIFGLVLFLIVVFHLLGKAWDWFFGRERVVQAKRAVAVSTLGFFELMHEYGRSKHDRICPEISFDK